jgi:hypothetical protein
MKPQVRKKLRAQVSRGQRLLSEIDNRIGASQWIELLGLLADAQEVLGEAAELVLRAHLEATMHADDPAAKPPMPTRAAAQIMKALTRFARPDERALSLAKSASSVRRRPRKKAARRARRT